ncbi:P-loop containing nucleoside triphosphate hydrolase protein [Pestalotiopsis sp. NC0098]|nr:P-loop containing nucleoside triphosphate hydrolase protein [Pestalotiopsis sp. NC0098]
MNSAYINAFLDPSLGFILFDEADVFLESRASAADVTRVGLVSVLLRVLEYYQGILILTTNRIKSFDIAVQSRINLAVKFDDLRETQRRTIFENLLGQLTDDYLEDKRGIINWFKEDEEAYKWCERLNGRQIRNVVFSAASLAGIREDKKLTLKEIKTMLRETYKFHDHLESVTLAAREKNEMYINRSTS